MELKGKTINFLGDSITEGVGASAPDKIYLNVLKEMAELSCVRNYGISATRYANQTDPDDTVGNAFSDRFYEMNNNADVVVVFGGTNDYGHGDAKMGSFDDRENNTFYGACHVLFSGLIKKYPESEIVIMTPLHREYDYMKSEKTGKTLKEYVDVIKEVAEYYSIPVLDLFSMGGLQPNIAEIKEKYVPDGLHPSDMGNKKIAERLYSFLKCL